MSHDVEVTRLVELYIENQIRVLQKLTSTKPLHSLLLNLSVDLMLRASDLLKLKVSDVLNEDRTVKEFVQVTQKKTGKATVFLFPTQISWTTREVASLTKSAHLFYLCGLFDLCMHSCSPGPEKSTEKRSRNLINQSDLLKLSGLPRDWK